MNPSSSTPSSGARDLCKTLALSYRLSLSLSLRAFFFFLAESIDFCLFTSHCEWHPGSALQKAAEAWKEEWHTE
jgi:hypothetical protein